MEIMKKIKLMLQYILPHHLASRLMSHVANCPWPLVRNWCINTFIKKYGVNMAEAVESDPTAYLHFNAFFTRHLKAGARPIVQGAHELACPVDGSISQRGDITREKIFQAKGFDFSLLTLLGGHHDLAASFENGRFMTLYLAPKDYHRIHMPMTGTLKTMVHIPGQLFSVNPFTTTTVSELFARNERVVCIFDTAIGPMAMILVGAFYVASINTVWAGEVTPPQQQKIRRWQYADHPITLERGAEMGHFKLGSTVIVLFPENAMDWNPDMVADSTVKMGQLLGTTRP